MVEIDNWIKEQLKKGHKKEQIKGGLRKAGYPKNIINSVDSLAKKKRNFNLALIFFIVIIIGIAFYLIYQNISFNDEEERLEIITGDMITITSDGFEPNEVIIKEGQTISFINEDIVSHNVSSVDGLLTSVDGLSNFIEVKPLKSSMLTIGLGKGEFYFYYDNSNEIIVKVIVTE